MEKKDMKPIGSKASPEAKKLFEQVCEDLGCSTYDAFQMFMDVMIQMRGNRRDLSYDMEQLIQLFDPKAWKDGIRLTDPVKAMSIVEAFYVLTESGRKGTRLVHVQGNNTDIFRQETYNVQVMVEKFMEYAMPNAYRSLRSLGVSLGTNSVYETITRILDEYNINPDQDELTLMFSDNDWERGHKMSDQQGHKSTRNNHPELFQ